MKTRLVEMRSCKSNPELFDYALIDIAYSSSFFRRFKVTPFDIEVVTGLNKIYLHEVPMLTTVCSEAREAFYAISSTGKEEGGSSEKHQDHSTKGCEGSGEVQESDGIAGLETGEDKVPSM
jgi:hypothetical protein